MKKIPFDIKYRPEIESGKYKVTTRDGRPARIVCWDAKYEQPIVALVCYNDDVEDSEFYSAQGRWYMDGDESPNDLIIVTDEPEQSEFEAFVYRVTTNKCEWKRQAQKLLALAKQEIMQYFDFDDISCLELAAKEYAKKNSSRYCVTVKHQKEVLYRLYDLIGVDRDSLPVPYDEDDEAED